MSSNDREHAEAFRGSGHDCELGIGPPVEGQYVQFMGCSEVWVPFDSFPAEETNTEVDINGDWESICGIRPSEELTETT